MLWSDTPDALAPSLVTVRSYRSSGLAKRGSPLRDNPAFLPIRGADEVIPSTHERVALLQKKRVVQLKFIASGVTRNGIRVGYIERRIREVRFAGRGIEVMPGVFIVHGSPEFEAIK